MIASLHSVSIQQKELIEQNHLAIDIQDGDAVENEDNIELQIEEEEEGENGLVEGVEEEEQDQEESQEVNDKKKRNKSSQKVIKLVQ